jgi:hypothetical protein
MVEHKHKTFLRALAAFVLAALVASFPSVLLADGTYGAGTYGGGLYDQGQVTTPAPTAPAVTGGGGLIFGSSPLAPGYVNTKAVATTNTVTITPNGSSAAISSTFAFTRDLTLGSTGSDVRTLQQFLNAHGYVLAQSGAGSPGNETTLFGGLTRAQVIKFQKANAISPAVGYFGPITRAFIISHNL